MRNFQETIWESGEYNYEAAYGFVPNIHAYLHDDDTVRPCMLVVPGGGYCMVCNVEGEPVAKVFYEKGMNVFVLTYTTDITMSVPLGKQPMNDLSRAIRYIRLRSAEYSVNPSKLTICGFSAGGHLCASIATHYSDVVDVNPEYSSISNRPDAVILGYPVISSGDITHIYSIYALLGRNASQDELDYFSLEKHVTVDTPPCFIWQTVEDDLVPIANSQVFAESCMKQHVPYAYYAFPHGRHGLSVANDDVKNGRFGAPYTFEQVDRAIENVKNYTAVGVSQQRHDELMVQFFGNVEGNIPTEDEGAKQKESEAKTEIAGTEAKTEIAGTEAKTEIAGTEAKAEIAGTEAKTEIAESETKEADAMMKENQAEEKKAPEPMKFYDDVSLWPLLAEHFLKGFNLI